ncbi:MULTISPECIES: hypothetical protein [unclassified Afipia]|uniref:hypothetical protein n=1 Tax=unclassified Afipia TaxID=2642050 RepID=UPI0004152C0C|nr:MULTISPECIES: hypothetical protein [unclassified Afipia]
MQFQKFLFPHPTFVASDSSTGCAGEIFPKRSDELICLKAGEILQLLPDYEGAVAAYSESDDDQGLLETLGKLQEQLLALANEMIAMRSTSLPAMRAKVAVLKHYLMVPDDQQIDGKAFELAVSLFDDLAIEAV